MQSMKRAASGAKAARKKVRTTTASGARAARKKVRTQVHGCRVWVWPCDKENVEVALKQKREGKKSWTAEAWKTCVDQEMKTNWHGRVPGGRRLPQITKKSAHKPRKRFYPMRINEKTWVRSSSWTSTYGKDGAVVCMKVPLRDFDHMSCTPQPVVNWLYQVLGRVLYETQSLLGVNKRFGPDGVYRDDLGRPASGGQVVAFWGTELGARREQALIAWDYDVDLAVFKTPNFDFGAAWAELRRVLEPLGLSCREHTAGLKYRVCPETPLVFNTFKELRHEIKEAGSAQGRASIALKAGAKLRSGGQPVAPTGDNCLDLEVYTVTKAPMNIRGSNRFQVTAEECFPVVEGVFGPLRVPLLRSPVVLKKEYGLQWSSTRLVKNNNGTYKTKAAAPLAKRAAWPSMELSDCGPFLGGYVGAGPRASPDDVPWRFD